MAPLLRSAALFALLSSVVALSLPGCSQQGEGERCDSAANGNADCADGLVCTPKGDLREGVTDRCCPADGSSSDSRCDPRSTGSTGGSSSGGTNSSSGGAPANAGAASVAGGAPASAGGMTSSSAAGMMSSSAGAPASNGGQAGAAGAPAGGGQGGAG